MAQQVRRGDVSTISAVIVPSRSSPLHTYDMDQRHSQRAYKAHSDYAVRLCLPKAHDVWEGEKHVGSHVQHASADHVKVQLPGQLD